MLWIVPLFRTKQEENDSAKMFFVVFSAMISVNAAFFFFYTIGNFGSLLYGSNFDYVSNIMIYFAFSSTFLAFFSFIGHYFKAKDQIKLVNQIRFLQVILSIVFFSIALKFRTLEAVAMAELFTSALVCSSSVLAVAKGYASPQKRKQSIP